MDASVLIHLALGAAGGFILGLAYFGSLWLGVGWLTGAAASSPQKDSLVVAAAPAMRLLLLNLLRFAGLGLGLYAIAQFGAAALIAGGAASLLARRVLVAKLGSEA